MSIIAPLSYQQGHILGRSRSVSGYRSVRTGHHGSQGSHSHQMGAMGPHTRLFLQTTTAHRGIRAWELESCFQHYFLCAHSELEKPVQIITTPWSSTIQRYTTPPEETFIASSWRVMVSEELVDYLFLMWCGWVSPCSLNSALQRERDWEQKKKHSLEACCRRTFEREKFLLLVSRISTCLVCRQSSNLFCFLLVIHAGIKKPFSITYDIYMSSWSSLPHFVHHSPP